MKKSPLDAPEIIEFIKRNADTLNNMEMLAAIKRMFGVSATYSQIRSFRCNRRLFGTGKTKGARPGASEAVFTQEQKHAIAWLCTTHSDRQLSELFAEKYGVDRTARQFKQFRQRNLIKCGRTGFFHTAENQCSYRPEKGVHFSPATEFKKGNIPHNHLEVGTEVISADGYRMVKVAEPNVWKQKSHLVWEEQYGKIPKDGRIIHIDGNPLNDSVENLRFITNTTLLLVNRAGGLNMPIPELNNAKISIYEIEARIRKGKF